MNYYDMDYPEVEPDENYQYIQPVPDYTYWGDCSLNKPVEITPYLLATTFEDSQTNYTPGYHEDMLIQEPGDPLAYRLVKGAENRSFKNNHPCAKLTKGTLVSYLCLNVQHRSIVEAVDLEQGKITFKDPPGVPYMILDSFGGSEDKKKTYNALLELDRRWSAESSDIRDFFLRKKHIGGVIKDADRFAYTQGVVGSGKSYQLCLDLQRQRTAGIWQFVVAETNSALITNGHMLESLGLRVLHFSREDSPFSMMKVLANCPSFHEWNTLTITPDKTERQLREMREAREVLMDYMKGYVILVTPSRAENLRRMISNDEQIVNIYLDEAGLMSFSRFVTLLLFKINRLWVYGDHEQHEPFSENVVYRPPQDIHYQKLAERTREIAEKSVAWLFQDMNYPKRFLSQSRRLPPEDAKVLLPVMYEGGKDWLTAGSWLEAKMPQVKKSYDATCWVPPSIQSYPWLSEDKKNKEAVRMRRFMNWLFFYIEAQKDHDGTKRTFDSKPDYVFISSHNYILGALREELEKWYSKKEYNLSHYKFEFLTTRLAQGDTFKRVVYYIPETATAFVTDPHHLVAMSRHTFDLIVAPYSIRGLLKPGMLSLLHMLGIVNLKLRPIQASPTSYTALSKRKKDLMKIEVLVQDYGRLQKFFSTKQYEEYRKLIDYPYLDEKAKERWRNSAKISDQVLHQFQSDPGKIIDFGGFGKYKHILMLLTKETFLVKGGNKAFDCLNFNGEMVSYDRFSVRLEFRENWIPRSLGKSIGLRRSNQKLMKYNSSGRKVPLVLPKGDAIAGNVYIPRLMSALL